ncbi:MAG: hypothetical protein QOJ02_1763 [Acidobacteriota bacterium]|jgi:hypothetical protein|nr:hypothetical protein [Acidobacteriota bacterium]
MSPAKSRQYPYLPDHLCNILSREFESSPLALALFNEFLPIKAYSRSFVLKLIDVARRSTGVSWEIRRLSALMLENQVLKLSPDRTDEFDFLLVQLGLKSAPGKSYEISDSVLKEGYSTTHLCHFILEFRRKLERLNRVHEKIAGARTSQRALQDFINLSKYDCKISIARYLFRPEEVVERIVRQVKTSRGVPDIDYDQPSNVDDEVAHTLSLLPDYEAQILRGLYQSPIIYWVSDATSSEINSLVEYPLTTIVLVIKPPGSALEFEIKRAGRRRHLPLNVIFRRNDWTVPPPHRLDGGSMLTFLRHESRAASRFSTIYRQVHRSEAPVSMIVSRLSIFSVPRNGTEENILEYFTNPHLFGNEFNVMRAFMKEAVAAFDDNDKEGRINLPGDLGLTMRFLNHSTPGQAILSGTSSFRLDKVAAYLSERGPEIYFGDRIQRVEYSRRDAKWLADEILEEVLGVYSPPAIPYRNHKQYVDAAFSVKANRARADRIFLDSVQQIGEFWGTLLAIRGFSWGESFVARNVGLKSFWSDGQWKVKIIFMDHDCLSVVDESERDFRPRDAFSGICTDARFIGENIVAAKFSRQTAIHFLKEIYRVKRNLGSQAQSLLYSSIQKAYRATHDAMLTNPVMRNLFHKVFVERIRDWDTIVKSYLAKRVQDSGLDSWRKNTKRRLKKKGYPMWLIETHLETVETYSDFLADQNFLY